MIMTVGLIHANAYSQHCGGLNIQYRSDIVSPCNRMIMTMIHDELNRPYLYVANKEAGLTVYDISTVSAPTLVATVPTSLLDTLDAMNVSQSGNYLYLAVGNSFTNPGVDEKNGPLLMYALDQNYPNPFNPVTVIRYRLHVESKVTLKIYDVLGQHVATLIDEVQEPGEQSVQWQASGSPSGVYFYTLRAGDFVESKKLLLLR